MITPFAAVKAGFRNYVAFGGRATRPEFWWWTLFIIVGGLVSIVTGVAIASATGLAVFASLFPVFVLATLLPTIAVTSRSRHDIGKSGWWQLAWHTAWVLTRVIASGDPLLPRAVTLCVGIWAVIWLAKPSEPGANDFGPDPRMADEATATFPARNDRAAGANG